MSEPSTSMRRPLALTWYDFGDVVQHRDKVSGITEPRFVFHACEESAKGVLCVTHDRYFPTLEGLYLHLGDGGAHRLVIACGPHRTYEAPDAQLVRAFEELMARDRAPAPDPAPAPEGA